MEVTAAPAAIAASAEGWTIAWAKAGPERVPTPARKSTNPNWRRVRFAVYGSCQTSGPVRAIAPSASPATSGPPA